MIEAQRALLLNRIDEKTGSSTMSEENKKIAIALLREAN